MSPDQLDAIRAALILLGCRTPTIVESTPQGYRLSGLDADRLLAASGRTGPKPCIVPRHQLSKLVRILPPGLAIIQG